MFIRTHGTFLWLLSRLLLHRSAQVLLCCHSRSFLSAFSFVLSQSGLVACCLCLWGWYCIIVSDLGCGQHSSQRLFVKLFSVCTCGGSHHTHTDSFIMGALFCVFSHRVVLSFSRSSVTSGLIHCTFLHLTDLLCSQGLSLHLHFLTHLAHQLCCSFLFSPMSHWEGMLHQQPYEFSEELKKTGGLWSEIFRHFQKISDTFRWAVGQLFRNSLFWYQSSSYTDCQYMAVIFRPAVFHTFRLSEYVSYFQCSSSAVPLNIRVYQIMSAQ